MRNSPSFPSFPQATLSDTRHLSYCRLHDNYGGVSLVDLSAQSRKVPTAVIESLEI
jgi:hypothetical protein